MPVVVGVIVAIIFLVAFSEWFYHIFSGWKGFILDDIYFRYRIIGASVVSILIMSGTFLALAYSNECKGETREGVFSSLNCEEYSNIMAEKDRLLMKIGTVNNPEE